MDPAQVCDDREGPDHEDDAGEVRPREGKAADAFLADVPGEGVKAVGDEVARDPAVEAVDGELRLAGVHPLLVLAVQVADLVHGAGGDQPLELEDQEHLHSDGHPEDHQGHRHPREAQAELPLPDDQLPHVADEGRDAHAVQVVSQGLGVVDDRVLLRLPLALGGGVRYFGAVQLVAMRLCTHLAVGHPRGAGGGRGSWR
mmetsp:Transcript_19317/g.60731  ORF Transcript_19317/g.60731 Transcript_19317/m.60731 type:complete len:200 (+) Transcript_19317:611-1210(+)